eukprot:m.251239 g.251239  ORF g.251239 m.251239 type:complete len:60 (-) comp15448_c0_seq4:4935-5114(-)
MHSAGLAVTLLCNITRATTKPVCLFACLRIASCEGPASPWCGPQSCTLLEGANVCLHMY